MFKKIHKCNFINFVIFGLFIFSAVNATDDDYCSRDDLNCIEKQSMKSRLIEYEMEMNKYKEILMQSNCSICTVNGDNPCHNGGTCVILDKYSFVCECPDNYAGKYCDTPIECKPNDCGKNAYCTVFNHKKTCSCPIGYTGNPKKSCSVKTKKACVHGDPHYRTYDKSTYNYQGTCPHYITKKCHNDSNVDDFSIIISNKFLPWAKTVSTIEEVWITIRELNIHFDPKHRLYINNRRKYYPYYYPSAFKPEITIIYGISHIVIKDRISDAKIDYFTTYGNPEICITLPESSDYYGKDTMCGALGNLDDNCNDDFIMENGTAIDSPCNAGSSMEIAKFVDTWVTDPTYNNCVLGEVVQNNTNCNTGTAVKKCQLIQQAINGQGPFAICWHMGTDVLQQYLNDCIYDVCHGQSKCDALTAFALACQSALNFADISSWRDDECPYSCPPHSTYSLQTPSCQSTCSDPFLGNSTFCQDSYHEGCKCNPGYYLDMNTGENGFDYSCIPYDKCGCNDVYGNYYPPNSTWLNDNCTVITSCENGHLFSETTSCSINGQCVLTLSGPQCQCDQGYSGDGINCQDINECLNSTLCGDHGTCVNDPGSYHCVCTPPYLGDDCSKYLPQRHCADLYVYHNITKNDVYNIQVGAIYGDNPTTGVNTTVYCDMITEGGGWTLINGGNNTSNKKFVEYEQGFGDPSTKSSWMGLKQIYLMTNQTETSLRVVIERCPGIDVPDQITECTYPTFSVFSPQENYTVYIPNFCQNGNESNPRYDGWVRWPLDQIGPKFVAYDNDDTRYNCSTEYLHTGWWFYADDDASFCGASNLNGVHYKCDGTNLYQGYLTWHYDPVENGWMYLRPKNYPNYDHGSS